MTASLPTRYPEERKWATVLFADVQGFTALSEKLDIELISDLLKGIWLRLDEVIRANGGYIDKHLGDGVMAVWGAPFAGENDAERAVSAGLRLVESLEKFSEESSLPGASDLIIRIGINTGPVLAGYMGVNKEYTVIGDAVNTARRIEENAEAGKVVVSESTYRLISSVFKVNQVDTIDAKGKTNPIKVYEIKSRTEHPTKVRYRSEDVFDTRMVGRDVEVSILKRLYEQTKRIKKPQLVLVTGDAGIGKSRFLMEFARDLHSKEAELKLFSTRALAQTSRVPYFLWKSFFWNIFNLDDDDPLEAVRQSFQERISRIWGICDDPKHPIEAAHLIGNLIGIEWGQNEYLFDYDENPDRINFRTYELFQEFLSRLCLHGPVILILDDLHWADNSSLELLNHILEHNSSPLQLMILAGARPQFLRLNPRWRNISQTISLGPLPIKAEIVAKAYPDLQEIPEEARYELVRRSDGNPYFLEEMAKDLVKSGVKDGKQSSQTIIEHIRKKTPESLREILQSRLDSLPTDVRSVALLASVVGRVFWVGAVLSAFRTSISTGTGLLTLAPSMIERVTQNSLRILLQLELVFPKEGQGFSEDQEYIFKHSLLRDVAYSLIQHKYLRQYHKAVAKWMMSKQDSKFQVMAAYHLAKAGENIVAAHQYDLAAANAKTRGALNEVEWLKTQADALRNKQNL